jgi:hypothetical protein
MKESDEAREQEDFWENKKRYNKDLLNKINTAIKEEFGKDPCKFQIYNSLLHIYLN